MGFPAKSYELFRLLGENLENDRQRHEPNISSLLRKFSIQSFIVYDPIKDPIFARKLENDFSYFDRLTGKRMMFICLLQEGNDDDRAGYKYHDFFNEASWVGKNASSRVSDVSLATQLLCSKLQLDYEHCPYLVFTTDFNSDTAFVVELSEENVEETMHTISSIAMQLTENNSNEDLKRSLLQQAWKIHLN